MKIRFFCLIVLFILSSSNLAYAEDEMQTKYNWITGGVKVELGTIADLDLGEEFAFLSGDDTRALMEEYQDKATGLEIGSVYPNDPNQTWSIIFEYEDTGHIKDDEKEDLDADAILKSYDEGTENANRDKPAEHQLHVTGWDVVPFYDETAHNLNWSIAAVNSQNEALVNYNVRLLTRVGYISAILISDPAHRENDRKLMNTAILPKIQAKSGQAYVDFDPSKDKVSKYGLTALIVGGAGLLVAKKIGILAVILLILKKAWIFIALAIGGGWKWFRARSGR